MRICVSLLDPNGAWNQKELQSLLKLTGSPIDLLKYTLGFKTAQIHEELQSHYTNSDSFFDLILKQWLAVCIKELAGRYVKRGEASCLDLDETIFMKKATAFG